MKEKKLLKCPNKPITKTYTDENDVEITETDFGDCDKYYCAAWDTEHNKCGYVFDE